MFQNFRYEKIHTKLGSLRKTIHLSRKYWLYLYLFKYQDNLFNTKKTSSKKKITRKSTRESFTIEDNGSERRNRK